MPTYRVAVRVVLKTTLEVEAQDILGADEKIRYLVADWSLGDFDSSQITCHPLKIKENICANCGGLYAADPIGSPGVYVHVAEDGIVLHDVDEDHVPY